MAYKIKDKETREFKRGTPEQFREIVAGRFGIPVEEMTTKAIMENHKFLGLKVYYRGDYKGDFIFEQEKNREQNIVGKSKFGIMRQEARLGIVE
jgi:hypothetical protein